MLIRLERARNGGLMARNGRKVGFPDRKFSIGGLKPGNEINIEITGHNPKGTVFFWRWVSDECLEKVERIKVCNYFSPSASHLQLLISYHDSLGVRREKTVEVYSLEDAIGFGVQDTDEWHRLAEHCGQRNEEIAVEQAAKEAGPESLEFVDGKVVVHYPGGISEELYNQIMVRDRLSEELAVEALDYLKKYRSDEAAAKKEIEDKMEAIMSRELLPIPSSQGGIEVEAANIRSSDRSWANNNGIFADVAIYCKCGNKIGKNACRGSRAKETLEERHPEFRELIRKTTYRYLRFEINSRCECDEEYGTIATSPELVSNGKFYRERMEGSDMWDGPY